MLVYGSLLHGMTALYIKLALADLITPKEYNYFISNKIAQDKMSHLVMRFHQQK